MSRIGLTTSMIGGLGNQLFILANFLATANRSQIILNHNHSDKSLEAFARVEIAPYLIKESSSSSCFESRPTYWGSLFKNIGYSTPQLYTSTERINESDPPKPVLLPLNTSEKNYHLFGFFQSPVYFKDQWETIKSILFPTEYCNISYLALRHYIASYMNQPVTRPEYAYSRMHCIGLHIRRGDYLKLSDTFHVLDFSYYERALKALLGKQLVSIPVYPERNGETVESCNYSSHANSIHILVFCEDTNYANLFHSWLQTKFTGVIAHIMNGNAIANVFMSFVNEHIDSFNEMYSSLIPKPILLSDIQSYSNLPNEVIELLLLMHCDDCIIANSTFSWWSAYANPMPYKRVVVPSNWFKNKTISPQYYCLNWIVL